MKILIVSDNHGQHNHLIDTVSVHDDMDYYIHLGDSESTYTDAILKPYLKVGGNCDFDMQFPNEAILNTPFGNIFYTHGHFYSVNRHRKQLAQVAKENECQFALYGHTHIKRIECIENVWCINPGSISQSRDSFVETYAILSLGEQTKITYYNQNHEPVDEMMLK